MSAPTSPTPTFNPSEPMSPKFRSDVAYRRAQGWTWKELAETLSCDVDELRVAAESDPEFVQAQQRAWAAAAWEGDADGLRRLRLLANTGSGDSARMAAEVLVRYAQERRCEEGRQAIEHERNQTRIAVEKIRAEARIAVEKMRTERAALKAAGQKEEEEEWVGPPRIVKETAEEFQKRSDREHAERAAAPEAKVYLWGGKHQLGRSIPPDETDTLVRLVDDYSVPNYGPGWNLIYWVVPREADSVAPGPREAQAADALKEKFDAHAADLSA